MLGAERKQRAIAEHDITLHAEIDGNRGHDEQRQRHARAGRDPAQVDLVVAHGGRELLEALSRLVDAGALRPQVEAMLPLDDAREALSRVARRHTRGKIVLQIGQ